MSYASQLHSYIAELRQRLRLGAWVRGAAIFAATALAVTVLLVLVLNHFAFPLRGVLWARAGILIALGGAAAFGMALPVVRLTRTRAVQRAEAAHPELNERLTTFEDRAQRGDDPFLELLAADTLRQTQNVPPAILIPKDRLWALGGAAAACLAVLVSMVLAGPGFLGYGASLLWTGAKKNAAPYYAIAVTPGNVTVRRNSDQLVVARVTGIEPGKAQIFARFQSASAWEPATMQQVADAGGGASYQFVLAGLPENVEYYVAAGPLVSTRYRIKVLDLPGIKQIGVTYRYPAWTGMKPVTEEHSGDLRAIEGTNAEIRIETDRPLKDGQFALDSGQAVKLTGAAANVYTGTIHMDKDGAYHLSASSDGQAVRLSEDYFIATDKVLPPQIAIDRPTGDYRASPIEEVTVGVKAQDEFGLKDMHLHYAVNGGADHDFSLLDAPGAKDAGGQHMIPLEDLKLVPGDVIAVYATARDGHSEARTDISFIQVDPFEREFSQSQQSGGGGGGGAGGSQNGGQTEISKREKELIAATWKQQNDSSAAPKDNAAQAQFLSEAQQKLRDQVNALSVRIQSRDIDQATEEFTDFNKDMQAASAAMGPAGDKLKATQWKDALTLEQKALQALLRAEATFRKIEVAFGQQGGAGGGAGGGNSGRDLASLFDLELDTAKNQYETAQTATPAEQHKKEVEDALAKLDALARRQEELANQPQNPQQSFEQRWQQEMLRREAEQLQRQMEQMAKNQQGTSGSQGQSSSQQGSQQQQGSSQQSGAQGESGSSGTPGQSQQQSAQAQNGVQSGTQGTRNQSSSQAGQDKSSDQRIEEALSRLNQATDMMKRNSPEQSAEDARAAGERLRQAQNLLAGSQQQLASGQVDSMAREAGRLAQEERSQSDRINQLVKSAQQAASGDAGATSDRMRTLLRERDQLATDRQQLSDDLSKLQRNMRNAQHDLASNQPEAEKKLRDALTGMDESDLDNHVQRTADWLRSGINPNSNGTEAEIARGLTTLSQQLQQAQNAVAQAKPGDQKERGAGQSDQTAALDRVERLRSELEAMARGQGGGSGQQGQNGNADNRNGQAYGTGQLNRSGQDGAGGQQSGNKAGNGAQSGNSGDTRPGGGGGNSGSVRDNYDTGNNTPALRGAGQGAPRDATRDASGNPADAERSIDQQLRELRKMVGGDQQAAKDVDALTRQMQNLDPSRFPGNPQMVEQMHREVLGTVDRLELELEHANASTDARTGKPETIPAGYQEQVAEYYRRLSKNDGRGGR